MQPERYQGSKRVRAKLVFTEVGPVLESLGIVSWVFLIAGAIGVVAAIFVGRESAPRGWALAIQAVLGGGFGWLACRVAGTALDLLADIRCALTALFNAEHAPEDDADGRG